MSRTAVNPSAAPVAALQTPADWWLSSLGNWVESQQLWLAAMLPWHEALVAAQRDLWDQWASHWAGGVPIDA